jgi:hypothetical protein
VDDFVELVANESCNLATTQARGQEQTHPLHRGHLHGRRLHLHSLVLVLHYFGLSFLHGASCCLRLLVVVVPEREYDMSGVSENMI